MRFLSYLMLASSVSAWTGMTPTPRFTTQQQQESSSMQSRRNFFGVVAGGIATSVLIQQQITIPAAFAADEDGPVIRKSDPAGTVVNLPNGVKYEVIKAGTGPAPDIGELCAIRFAAYNGDVKLDDVFDTPEPYYTRVGSGGLLKGVEQTLPLMQLGDRWKLTIPGNLAFGEKGRPASAGKPRIPGNAVITFEIEMVGLPGKEPELIELIGDF